MGVTEPRHWYFGTFFLRRTVPLVSGLSVTSWNNVRVCSFCSRVLKFKLPTPRFIVSNIELIISTIKAKQHSFLIFVRIWPEIKEFSKIVWPQWHSRLPIFITIEYNFVTELPTCNEHDWSPYFNTDDPGSEGDIEFLLNIQHLYPFALCANPTVLQARVVNDLSSDIIQNVHSNVTEGFKCLHSENDEPCEDYEVRFCCPGNQNLFFLPLL